MAQGSARPLRQSQDRKIPSYSPKQDRDNKVKVNDEATTAFIKRILCAPDADSTSTKETSDPDYRSAERLEELLPPLSSCNEIDVQLYALIAVILDLFVQTWYSRITPDREFVASIVQIVAHCTRALEQRLRHIDLESLVLDELPALLSEHVDAVRIAHESRSTKLTTKEVRLRYHALRPHPALSPCPVNLEAASAQQESEVAWCLLLVNRVLSLLLPPEDLQNPCLDVLVSEVLSELVFHNGVCGKACEPWLLWDAIAKLVRAQRPAEGPGTQMRAPSPDDLIGHERLATKAASDSAHDLSLSRRRLLAITRAFWTVLQAIVTIYILLRSFAIAIMHASKIPARTRGSVQTLGKPPASHRHPEEPPSQASVLDCNATPAPIVSMYIWRCMSTLLALEQRMPWLSGMCSLFLWTILHGPGQLCRTNSKLDRLLSSHVHKRLLSPNWVPSAVQAARSAIFPENVLAPVRVPPTDHEVLLIKRDCATAIIDAVPEIVRGRFFATHDIDLMIQDIECELDLLGDSHLNKHIVVRVVELIVARIFPELADDSGESNTQVATQSELG